MLGPRPASKTAWLGTVVCWALPALLGGCSVDVDLSDKRCPCAEGYHCDPVENRCVAGPGCEPKIRVGSFQAAWSTTNTIHWTWEPEGAEEDFLRYELVVAETPDEVTGRTGTAQVFGPDRNPELGGFLLPRTNGTDDVVRGTLTDGLAADTSYVGQLLAIDDQLCAHASDLVGMGTTIELPDEVVIFRDETPPGFLLPASFGPVDDAAGTGRHLEFRPADDPECASSGVSTCGQPLRLQDLNLDLGRLTAGTFETAFLEFRIANDGTIPSYYSLTWLWFAGCAEEEHYRFVPYTIRADDEYQRVQIPLDGFPRESDGTLLTHDVLATDQAGTPLCGLGIAGAWQLDATIRIDDIRVRF